MFPDVVGIHHDAPPIVGVISAHDLPQPRDAGFRGDVRAQISAIAQHFFSNYGPGSDEAHLAAEDIPELRKLVQTRLAQKPSESRDAGVVLELVVAQPFGFRIGVAFEQVTQKLLGVRDHGAELQAVERLPVSADALMAEEDRAAFGTHPQGNHKDEWREHEADGE